MNRGAPNSACEASGSSSTLSPQPPSATSEDVLPTAEHFKEQLATISDGREIREALTFCRKIFEREEQRAASFESKATTLIAFGALAAAFVSGFAALLLDEATAPCVCVVKVLAALYALLVLSFFCGIVFAAIALWPQKIMSPRPGDILKLAESNDTLALVRRERAGDFYESYLANRQITNKKGFWVMAAQLSVALGMAFLLLIAVVLACHLILS